MPLPTNANATEVNADQLLDNVPDDQVEGQVSGESDDDVDLDSLLNEFGFNQTPTDPSSETEQLRRALAEREMRDRLAAQQQFVQFDNYVRSQIAAMPNPQEQQIASVIYNTWLNAQQTAMERDQAMAYVNQMQNSLLPLVKETGLERISKSAKVQKDLIAKYATDARSAQAIALALAEYRKNNAVQQRRNAKVDSVPSGTGGASFPQNSDHATLAKTLAGSGNLEEYIRARWG